MAKKQLSEEQQHLIASISEELYDKAGWGDGDASKEEAHAIEAQISKLKDQVRQLEQQLAQLDDRAEIATETIEKLVVDMGPMAEAARKQILELVAAKMGVSFKKKRQKSKSTGPSDTDLQVVKDVLDHDGMTFGEIMKALPEGTDKQRVRAALISLLENEQIGSEGERRGKKYFLFDEDADDE
jgi:hypothetical protein